MKAPVTYAVSAVALSALVAAVGLARDEAPQPKQPEVVEKEVEQKVVEVCFVLDTTGSMSGLIEGAKQKIWSIANDIVAAKPQPKVHFGLVGYRDRGDDYVTKVSKMTDDIDAIYAELSAFKADGGGDTPESVNEALHDAISNMGWNEDPSVLRIVYLVGDAPPQKYEDGKRWQDVCELAVKKDIIINTIQCGSIAGTAEAWKAIAGNGRGVYAALPQDGNMAHIEAPQDKELVELNAKIGTTLIPCGEAQQREEVWAKQSFSEKAPAAASASRLSYNSKTGKSVQGGNELIDGLKDGSIKLDEVKPGELPEELRKLSKEELKEHVAKKQAERDAIQKRIVELSKARDEYVANERKKLAAEGKGDSFDEEVSRTLRRQAAEKSIEFE